jgi:hypothetical protein
MQSVLVVMTAPVLDQDTGLFVAIGSTPASDTHREAAH